MKEHWSLIISKPESANLNSFEGGDFKSVSLADSTTRLKNICGENFKEGSLESFKILGEHRNQIVHFAHTGFNEDKNVFLSERWVCWHYLYELINNDWFVYFESYKAELDAVNSNIRKNRGFLKVKFEAIQDEIAIERSRKREILECTSCHFESAVVTEKNSWGKDFECLVCEVKDEIPVDIVASIPCEECGELVQYFMLDNNKCPHCKNEINKDYALNEYNNLYRQDEESEDFDESAYPIGYCHDCQSDTPSVVEVESMPVCILCGVRGWTIMQCDHCSKYVTGGGEKIMALGCHLCEDEYRKKWMRET